MKRGSEPSPLRGVDTKMAGTSPAIRIDAF
jgi:hypothetical protein